MEQIRQNRDHDNVTNNSSESSPSLGSATNVNTNEVPTPLLNDNVSIESSITSNDVNVNSETKDGFVMGDQKMNINDPKQSTTIMQQCPGGVVGPKIENLVCDCGKGLYFLMAIFATAAILLIWVSYCRSAQPVIHLEYNSTAMRQLGEAFHLKITFAYGPSAGQKPTKSDYSLSFVNVAHWQNLSQSKIDDRLFNFVLATTWSQWLCDDNKDFNLLRLYEKYVNKAIDVLKYPPKNFSEYKFIDTFKDLSVVDDDHLQYVDGDVSSDRLLEDFSSLLYECVYLIKSFRKIDSISVAYKCMVVRLFRKTRNSIFQQSNEKLKLFLNEVSSKVFTFATFLHLNFDPRTMSGDEDKAISITLENVFTYLSDSLATLERDYSSLIANTNYFMEVQLELDYPFAY